MTGDPIADMLTQIRNAQARFKEEVRMPSSRLKEEIARILVEEGYVESCSVEPGEHYPMLKIRLKYKKEGPRTRRPALQGGRRVSRPSRRVYVGCEEVPLSRGGLGTAILSTSQGIMTGREARRRKIGGELLLEVW